MSEQRLIDAVALIKKFNIDDMTNVNGCVPMAIAQRTINEAPTIDAVPVVRGRWVDTYKSGYHPQNCDICSACDCWSARKSAYCPNCGARMDG
jgi:hypothetical protein